MFNDKLQPIYDGRVLVNQTPMDNPVVKAALAEMSEKLWTTEDTSRVWYISDRH